jgi:uncharacterized phage-associated protein
MSNRRIEKKSEPRLRFRPKSRKIVELLLYLAHKKPGVDHYTACKLVYLADLAHLNKYGRPIVSDAHTAMEWGPVASRAYELLQEKPASMEDAGLKALPFELEKLDKVIVIVGPKRAVDKQFFSRSDLGVFDEVLAKYGELSFGELHDQTSQHVGYKIAWENKGERRKSAPIAYDDMLTEAASKEEYIDEIAPLSHKI